MYPDGDVVRGYWECLSDQCHRFFPQSIIGFTKGVLSNQRYGWRQEGDRTESHFKAVDYIIDFLGFKDIEDVEVDFERAEMLRFNAQVELMARRPLSALHALCDRRQFRRSVIIPAEYYLKRGYSKEILDKYDVGLCLKRQSPMYGRVVVPFYDETHRLVIGVIGRATSPHCSKCDLYHDRSPCPEFGDRVAACKWRTSEKFVDKHFLFNLWNASPYIIKSRSIILVEGAGDVFKLEESGIHNSCAILGNSLHDAQKIIIESCGADNIIVLTDLDDAGEQAEAAIRRACETYANVRRVKPVGKDVGEMTVEQVRSTILPEITKYSAKYF